MGFKFNPTTGTLDLVGEKATSVKSLTDKKLATQTVSALQIIYFNNSNECSLSDNSSYAQAVSAGMALNAANSGEEVNILVSGTYQDASFFYALNEPLFLGTNGSIQTTQPASGSYLTQVGFGLGVGSIYIRIGNPKSL